MGSIAESNNLLSTNDLQAASTSELFDLEGKKTTFGDLTHGKRVVVVFVRHFCISYSVIVPP